MVAFDENSLICDFAETYHIYDYRALPLKRVAVLACGLRENSRIVSKLSGFNISLDTLLYASMVDELSLLLWTFSSKKEKPKSFVNVLTGIAEKKNNTDSFRKFNSGEAFMKARGKIVEGV